jgi:hypothetical protein
MDERKKILRQTLLNVVEKQIRGNNPPETKITLERLVSEGFSKSQAKELIMCVLADHINYVITEMREFDTEKYVKDLKRLPEIDVE